MEDAEGFSGLWDLNSFGKKIGGMGVCSLEEIIHSKMMARAQNFICRFNGQDLGDCGSH